MSLRELPARCSRVLSKDARPTVNCQQWAQQRLASTATPTGKASVDLTDLESESSLRPSKPPADLVNTFDPVKRAEERKVLLPRARYQFRAPRYYRGPCHPYQPPPPSDPSSREFIPGPFSIPRLQQTYTSTIAPDILTLAYQHRPPGFEPPEKAPRLRVWDDSSPYYKNRPPRGPRGGDVLKLLRKQITFRNVPRVERITVHTFVSAAIDDSAYLHTAGMALQAVTSVRPTVHKSKHGVAQWDLKPGKAISLTCELKGEDMWHFLSKVVDVVMPRIKDFQGVKGSSGDGSGNISFGFSQDAVSLFPEIEVNYDMYPSKMIPGFHVTVHTTARTDRDARLLLSAFGIPFYGKLIN